MFLFPCLFSFYQLLMLTYLLFNDFLAGSYLFLEQSICGSYQRYSL